ncbi:Bud site selection protein 20 [Tulasnella sp. JGI-2019a]|nr:Bud site selection protein 20 [Tulasnella sp. JGI-2019a]
MGRLRGKRTHHGHDPHKHWKTKRREKDIDQIQLVDLDPKHRAKLEAQPLNVDLPGLGQHYCVECARYFETDVALKGHWKTKVHKKRLKELKEPAYTIEEAERAGGLGREERRSKIVSIGEEGAAEKL